jgi:hypothetical protein
VRQSFAYEPWNLERAMMEGETPRVRVRLPDTALRADLRDFLHRWGCVTYEVDDDTIEVIVSDVPAERQGRRELDLYLETWRAYHPGLELELLD